MRMLRYSLASMLVCLSSSGCGGIVTSSGSDASAADTSKPDVCVGVSKCSGDVPPTADSIASCRRAVADAACGSAYQALGECAIANQRCGADGKTDGTYLTSVCASQIDVYMKCYLRDGGVGP
jgi:hypothetical protein